MGLFGNDASKAKLTKLQKENEDLKAQLAEYDKVFGNFEDMKRVTDRVREENKRLIEKLEESVEVKAKMQKLIDELTDAVNAKKDEFQHKIVAIRSDSDNIIVGNNVVVTGGVSTPKSVTTGDNTVINGDIKCQERVSLGAKSTVRGVIEASQAITVASSSTLERELHATGPIELGASCNAGILESDADIHVGSQSTVKKILSGANVYLGDGVRITQGIEYRGSITIGKDVTISGEIRTRQ